MAVIQGGENVLVRVNGETIYGLLHASISSRNCFSADSFAVTFAVGKSPLSDTAFWASTLSAYVEIDVYDGSGPMAQLITGLVDTITLDPVHRTVAVEGRDLSSSMIDSYRQQDFVNQTASEVVSLIALSHNLSPVVTATSEVAGRYYGDGYTRLSLGQFSRLRSDWDVLVQLARENSFDVYVQGRSLFFQPELSFPGNVSAVQMNKVRTLRVERSLSITQTPTARVQSWNSQNMTLQDSSAANGPSVVDPSTFLFSSANLTASQVADSAARYSTELKRLKTILHLEMTWDLELAPRQNVLVTGTGLPTDDIFRIDSIDRRYSSSSGSIQRVHAFKLD